MVAVMALALLSALSSGAAGAATSWTVAAAPELQGAATGAYYLSAVSCQVVGECVAVGQYDNNGLFQPLTEVLSAGVWTPSAAALVLPADDGSLSAISCTALGDCVAVGSEQTPGGTSAALIDTETNRTWTASEVPSYATFNAVACPQLGDCVAIGESEETQSGQVLFTATEVNGTWTVANPPLSTTVGTTPYDTWGALSCPSVGTCEAVGNIDGFPAPCDTVGTCGNPVAFIDTLSDGTWSVASTPPIPTAATATPYSMYDAISCSSADSCMAVGEFVDVNDTMHGFADVLAGSTWTSSEAPAVAGESGDQLNDVSCPSSSIGTCIAVGAGMEPNDVAIADSYSSGAWEQSLPTPSVPPLAETLSSVSCASARSCVAVGWMYSGTGYLPTIDMLASGSWNVQVAEVPGNATAPASRPPTRDTLGAVDCSPIDCVAVGGYSIGPPIGFRDNEYAQTAMIQTLPVAPSTTEVQLSMLPRLRRGDERDLAMTVRVASLSGWLPAGRVVVTDQSGRPVCAATLGDNASATCAFTPDQLMPRRYVLSARFEAATQGFFDSTSPEHHLVVALSTTILKGSSSKVERTVKGWRLSLQARLVSKTTGGDLSGVLVRFWLRGSTRLRCGALTNARGVASCAISATGKAQFHYYEATFARSFAFLQSRAYGSICDIDQQCNGDGGRS
jgi:hypothetical protein